MSARLTYEQLTFEHDPRLPESLAAERARRSGDRGGPPVPARTRTAAVAGVGARRRPGQRRPICWSPGSVGSSDELGFNVALPIQPGHGARRNAWPTYPDTDPLANVAGMMRAVSEVRAVVRWLRAAGAVRSRCPGCRWVARSPRWCRIWSRVDAVAVYTPILGLNAMIAAPPGPVGAVGAARPSSCCSRTSLSGVTSVDRPAGRRADGAAGAPADRRRLA